MKKVNWQAFRPVKDRVAAYLADGKTCSILEIVEAVDASNYHVRTILKTMCSRGEATETYERRGRHAVVVYSLVARPRGRGTRTPVSTKRR